MRRGDQGERLSMDAGSTLPSPITLPSGNVSLPLLLSGVYAAMSSPAASSRSAASFAASLSRASFRSR